MLTGWIILGRLLPAVTISRRISALKETALVKEKIKHYLLIAGALGAVYFFSCYHIIIHDKDFSLLRKPYLTLEYTFYNITNRDAEDILEEDLLRESGIGELLVDLGWLDENRRVILENQYDSEASEWMAEE
jgi:hypothetical protein